MAERESLQSRLAYEAKCIENDVSSRSVHAILLEASDAIGVVTKLAEDMGRESVARRDRLKACIDRLDIRQDEDGSQHDEIDRLRFALSEMEHRAKTAESKLHQCQADAAQLQYALEQSEQAYLALQSRLSACQKLLDDWLEADRRGQAIPIPAGVGMLRQAIAGAVETLMQNEKEN